MKIWLVTIGEPVPVQGEGDRLHRTGYFARYLARQGHHVVWWTSAFDHFRKRHHFNHDAAIRTPDGLDIRLLHGCGYKRNLSVQRILDHSMVARRFARAVRGQGRPDVIVSALPTIDLCDRCVRLGRTLDVPVVLDLRDMWPDLFLDYFPSVLAPVGRLLLRPMFRQAQAALSGATAVIGITEPFVEWGLKRAGRPRTELDRAFPFGYDTAPPPAADIEAAERHWDALGVVTDPAVFTVCYVGTLGRQLDLAHVIDAARMLRDRGRRFQFVLCGTGDRRAEYQEAAREIPGVLFPGWIHAAQIYALLRRCAMGLDPLPERDDFLATVNNKAVEYLSAGLPVVSSPTRGELFELLRQERCGYSYDAHDAESLARLLGSLAGRRDSIAAMSANASRLFHQRFQADVVCARLAAHLEQVCRADSSHERRAETDEVVRALSPQSRAEPE